MRLVADANTILSGLFFAGNERRLLVTALLGQITLLHPEDVVDAVYEVIERTFHNHIDLPEALDRLEAILALGSLVARDEYARDIPTWSTRLRDPEDAPILACASATDADGIVTGDRDIIEFDGVKGLKVYRSKEVLDRLRRESRTEGQ